jgi:hypothetical protein
MQGFKQDQLELPAAACEIWDIRIATSESWDAATEIENTSSRAVDAKLASVHDSGMGLWQTDWATVTEPPWGGVH